MFLLPMFCHYYPNRRTLSFDQQLHLNQEVVDKTPERKPLGKNCHLEDPLFSCCIRLVLRPTCFKPQADTALTTSSCLDFVFLPFRRPLQISTEFSHHCKASSLIPLHPTSARNFLPIAFCLSFRCHSVPPLLSFLSEVAIMTNSRLCECLHCFKLQE